MRLLILVLAMSLVAPLHAALSSPPERKGELLLGTPADAGRAASCSDGVSASEAACKTAGGTWTAGRAGRDSSGGVYEIRSVIETGVMLLITICVAWGAYRVSRRFIKSAAVGGSSGRGR